MATKQKYTNRAKVIAWNKSMRMDFTTSLPSAVVGIFTMINTIEGMETALAQIQTHLENRKEREAANADMQTLQKGE
ncbi:hypothetical protein OFY82_004371 [Salmonella enterica]|nr:hypothetical protein [Salmonella enterica]EKP2024903.1 hypothetical protein [Salmonella enterica]EKP2052641.1 hypothetical protein [Salmonella enterica]